MRPWPAAVWEVATTPAIGTSAFEKSEVAFGSVCDLSATTNVEPASSVGVRPIVDGRGIDTDDG